MAQLENIRNYWNLRAEGYSAQNMDSIVINEAVELCKKYAGEKDYQFVNGVLGSVSKELHPKD